MSTCEWSERVAMLLDEDDAATRSHVSTCPACSELLADLEADRTRLRSTPVPEMRLRIRRRPMAWPWAAAAAVLIGAWLWPRPAEVEPLAFTPPVPPAPVLTQTARVAPQVVVKKKPRPQPAPTLAEALEAALPPLANPPAAASGDVLIAMRTEDPNVIIVLVGGDSND